MNATRAKGVMPPRIAVVAILVSLIIMVAAGAASAIILDPAPAVPLSAGGTIPATVTMRIEILSTPLTGGNPSIPGNVFEVTLPAGPVTTWYPPLVAALATQPELVVGATTQPSPGMMSTPMSAQTGLRVGFRVISTTVPPILPPVPFMPAITPNAIPFPPTPGQNPWATNFNNTAVAVGLIGSHFLAYPPFFNKTAAAGPNDPRIYFEQQSIPTLDEWGLAALVIVLLTIGTYFYVRYGRRRAVKT